MQPVTASLATKLVRIGAALLVLALASIGFTLYVTRQLEGGAAAVNEAGRMRMQTWRLASMVQGQLPAAEINARVASFDHSLALLRAGDPGRPLAVPWDTEVRQRFGAVEALWAQQRGVWLADAPPGAPALQQQASDFVSAIDSLVSAIERQLAEATAILNLFQFVMLVLAIAGAVIMLYTGYMYVINPLGHLRRGLEQLEAGQFSTRVDVDTQDEFGQVAAGFNRMAGTLQSLYAGLEAQVAAKTRAIEAQRARLEALYEVSAFLAQATDITALSQGFSQRVRTFMKADAVAVRWSDEANQRYLLLASDCFPREMQEEERSILAGACACGRADLVRDPGIRVIPIQLEQAAPMKNCARLGYRTLVSVPVRLHERVLGEVDLFFRGDLQLNADETSLLDALVANLASALESLRAAALERETAVGEERALLARELHDSIAQSLSFLKIQVQLLRAAIQQQQTDQVGQTLDELDAGLRESINDVRELLVHFRTRTNAQDIEVALQETLQKFQHQTGLPAALTVDGAGLPLPADVQVQVLHVLQEALSNVRKHARASQVHLTVRKGPQWRFAVRDDGQGFDAAGHRNETQVGTRIMRERAERIGATVSIDSRPGAGTTVELTLPPAAQPAADAAGSVPLQFTPGIQPA